MAQKNTQQNAQSGDESVELERHIDQMMDPKIPDSQPVRPKSSGITGLSGAPDLPALDIFEGSKKRPIGSKPLESAGTNQPVSARPAEQTSGASENDSAADPLVDDIIAREGDDLLAAQDADIAAAFSTHQPSFREKIALAIRAWWHNKWARYLTLGFVLLTFVAAGIVPSSRYYVLNTVGVRAAASLTILDSTTSQPLKNVAVSLAGQTKQTNADGVVRLESTRLGPQQLQISQLGFAKVERTVTLGLGSNPLGEVELRAVGAQFKFKLTDFLSAKPIRRAEASSGDANAQTNDKGEIILTIGTVDTPKLTVTLTANGYRSEKISVDTTTTGLTPIAMVSSRGEVYVSKQSGKYDVYKIDIDGKNKKMLLSGSGTEREQISLVPHPTDNMVALVSSRDNKRSTDGYLLDTLTLIDVSDGSVLTLEHSERIQVIDWVGDRLVYVKIKAGTSAGNPERHQLMSYDYQSTSRSQLAAANYFNDIVSAKGAIYYAASNNYMGGQSSFNRVNPDNTGKQTLLSAEVWNIMRSSYDELQLFGAQTWYSYRLGDASAKKLSQPPANTNETRFYLDAPDAKQALWTEVRDGKGVLLSYDAVSRKDKVLATQSGLSYPLRWLDNRTVIYRVVTPAETASYVVSLDGGSPKKITDVTNTIGHGKWMYY